MEVIMKPTDACNGTCVYCSAKGRLDNVSVLSEQRLESLFAILSAWLRENDERNLRFTWHGGEPMLCRPEYYGTVVKQQRRVFGRDMRRVKNTMQSNLSLVNEKWVPYLHELLDGQPIGTSFDIVDGVRGLASGESLADVWLRGVRLLRSNGIPVGVVYVVHGKSLGRASDLYYYFRNVDASMPVRFNPLYREGRGAEGESRRLWISAEEYGRFLVDLCDVWLEDNKRHTIMPLVEWHRAWRGGAGLCCDSAGQCHRTHIGIDSDGSVFRCGRGSDSGAGRLGNIFEDDLRGILQRRRQGDLALRSTRLREGHCRDCRYWPLCHGGCPEMAWLYYEDLMRETYFCAARKRIFEHFERVFGPPTYMRASEEGPSG